MEEPPSSGEKEEDPWEVIGSDPESFLDRHPWSARLFHYFMMALMGTIVFAIGGGLAFLVMARRMGLRETPFSAWSRFILGGTLTLTWLIVILVRRRNRDLM